MDEKTEELRDIFLETTGEDTVTERQEEGHGSLSGPGEDDVAARVAALVGRMRERYDFESGLETESLVTLARLYFEGAEDEEIAADLDLDPETILRARLDLHLVAAGDRDLPAEAEGSFQRLRSLRAEGASLDDCGEALGVDPEALERAVAVADADIRSTRANDRFRDEFAELLDESDLRGGHTDEAHEDGLREAAEDIETNVSF